MRFLFVDRICALEKGKRVRAIKNISGDEGFLAEIFPGLPVLSPVIAAEAAAQALSWLIVEARDFAVKPLITVLDEYVCHKHVQPGDQIAMEGEVESFQRESALAHARILINETPAIEINHGVCYLFPLSALQDPADAQRQFQHLCEKPFLTAPAAAQRSPLVREGAAPNLRDSGIDRIIFYEERQRIVGIKNITTTADYFNDHFPRKPLLPGVVIMDALIGCARILINRALTAHGWEQMQAVLVRAHKVKFRRFVQPGDQLVVQVQMGEFTEQQSMVHAKALVHDKVAATLAAEFCHLDRDTYLKTFLS